MQNVNRLGGAIMTIPKFHPGDIFFIMSTDNRLSRWIAWFMDSKFSHSGMILEETARRIYTCETSDLEVAYFDLEHYLNDTTIVLEVLRLPVRLETGEEMAAEATKYARTIYGYLQLFFSFSIRELIRKVFRRIVPNFIRQGMVCCHVILYACKKSGIQRLEEQDPEGIQTQETYELLKKCGAVVIYQK